MLIRYAISIAGLNVSSDDISVIWVLAIALTAILGPTGLIVWLLPRALRRSRAADGEQPSPRGFDVVGVEVKRPVA
jgi:hypothetical protein